MSQTSKKVGKKKKKRKKKSWCRKAVAAAAALVVLVGVGLVFNARRAKAEGDQALTRAREFMQSDNFDDAIALAAQFRNKFPEESEPGKVWTDVEIEALTKARLVPELSNLYFENREAFQDHEEASVLVARALMAGDPREFDALRRMWQGRETLKAAWLALDVDFMNREGQSEKALEVLNTTQLEGRAESVRLTRLALMSGQKNPEATWKLLEQAYGADSTNADVRVFRAQFLEALGKRSEARIEYVAALFADNENPIYLDRLADFYRRSGSYSLAFDSWTAKLDEKTPDFIWLKSYFWARVARPRDLPAPPEDLDEQELGPLAHYLSALESDSFWNHSQFKQLPEANSLLTIRQETYWLRLLQALADKNEKQAIEILQLNPFRSGSFQPVMENALNRILAFRRDKIFDSLTSEPARNALVQGDRHSFLRQVVELAKHNDAYNSAPELQKDVASLLTGDFAFVAVFLTGGWLESALRLHGDRRVPDDHPEWLVYSLAQAYRICRGHEQAIQFLAKHPVTPERELLRAECLLSLNQNATGLPLLGKLANEQSDVGFRATWLLAMMKIDAKDYAQAKSLIEKQTGLREHVIGKEMLARIALVTDQQNEAIRIYTAIGSESLEAGAFLAREAFARKNWKEAKRITVSLLSKYPDELQLRANLEEIERREQELVKP